MNRNIYWNKLVKVDEVITFKGIKYKVLRQSDLWKKGAFCQGYYTTISKVQDENIAK